MELQTDKYYVRLVNDPDRLTYRLRMSGFFDVEAISKTVEEIRKVADSYGGKSHLILADMRGLKTMTQEVSNIFHDGIAYDRKNGAYKCAHLSDSIVQGLQVKRIAREVSPDDDITINVVSLDEAEKLLSEVYQDLIRRSS